MKNSITLIILLIAMLGCSLNKKQKCEQTDSTSLKLDGFWLLSFSQYKGEKTSEQTGCFIPDIPIEALYKPYALGSHLLVKEDSISVFRYPYAYYGTFKYEIIGDSLFIKSANTSTDKFSIQKTNEDTLVLIFEEAFTSSCLLSARAKYESFTPNPEIINKLIQDSISCDSMIGKWWYLRKEIDHEDGIEPSILNFPKGMPDSIFISPETINRNSHKPLIELRLDNRMVKMIIKNPYEYSFTLTPEFKNDKILFSDFIDYGEYGSIDTVYYDVIYRR